MGSLCFTPGCSHPCDPAKQGSALNVLSCSAVQDLKEEIDIRLSRVQDIKYEPQLLAEDDSRLLQLETQGDVPITAGTSVGLLPVRHIRGAAVRHIRGAAVRHIRGAGLVAGLLLVLLASWGYLCALLSPRFGFSLFQAAIITCTG